MTEIFLALGSNLGDRRANLDAAIVALPPQVTVLERSPVYETDPRYVVDQPQFLNMALHGRTSLDAPALLRQIKAIERKLGRVETIRFGPRVIDLDIVFFGDEIIRTPELTVPHPLLAERAFVLRPLADIAPDRRHPATGRTVREMLAELGDDGGLRRFTGGG